MALLIGLGPALGVPAWLAADAERAGVGAVHDAGWLFYLGLPVTVAWYAFRARGRGGWWLAAKLYAITVGGALGPVWVPSSGPWWARRPAPLRKAAADG